MQKFNLSLSWKFYFGIMSLLAFWLAWQYSSRYPEMRSIDTIAFVWWSIVTVRCFLHLFDQLAIDSDGFHCRLGGILYSGKWSEVTRIANQRHLFPGLESLRQGVYIPSVKLTSGKNWQFDREFFLPLSMFVPNWQESTQKQKVSELIARPQAGSKIVF